MPRMATSVFTGSETPTVNVIAAVRVGGRVVRGHGGSPRPDWIVGRPAGDRMGPHTQGAPWRVHAPHATASSFKEHMTVRKHRWSAIATDISAPDAPTGLAPRGARAQRQRREVTLHDS
jgi:hypothetical protein